LVLNYINDDAFGSRIADALMNESYYSGIDDEIKQETKGLTKAEETIIIKRIAEIMKGCGRRTRAKKKV
jgi:hypothetical protein